MENRLAALELSSQELLRGQRDVKREISCITNTWNEFSKVYLPLLELVLEREQERKKLRRALIEKGLLAGILALSAFIGNAVVAHVIEMLKTVPK